MDRLNRLQYQVPFKLPSMNVHHNGYIRTIGRKLFYAPRRLFWIRRVTHEPKGEFKVRCRGWFGELDRKHGWTKEKTCFSYRKSRHIYSTIVPKCSKCQKKKKNRGTLKRSAKNRADGKKLRQQSEQQEQLLRQSKRRRWRTRGNKKLLGPGRTHTSW